MGLSALFSLSVALNFSATYPFRVGVADCLSRRGTLAHRLIAGKLRVLLSSLLFGFLSLTVLFEIAVQNPPLFWGYLTVNVLLSFLLASFVGRLLAGTVKEEVLDYLTLLWVPPLTVVLTVVPYALLALFTLKVGSVLPENSPLEYFKKLYEVHISRNDCPLLGWPKLFLQYSEYLYWLAVLNFLAFKGKIFLAGALLLLIKGGISAWVINRNALLVAKFLRDLRKSFGLPS